MDIDGLLRTAIRRRASDLHLKVDNHPCLRIDGRLHPMEKQPIVQAEDNQTLAEKILSPEQRKRFRITHEVDLSHHRQGIGRFRVNVFHQRGFIGIVFRIIPPVIQRIHELNLPTVLE